MCNGRRILDADAHVVEPADVFGDAQRVGPELMDLPATTPFEAAGDTSKLADFFESGCAADAYLRCMDTQGIDAVVLYPSIGLYAPDLPQLDPKDSAARCRPDHNWIARPRAPGPAMPPRMEQGAEGASLMLEGALERPPTRRVAFLEGGTGWLPSWLARLEGHAGWMHDTERAGLSLSPWESSARQCMISTDP